MKKFIVCVVIFFVAGVAAAFIGVSGGMTFVIGGICVLLYLILSRKKGSSSNEKEFRTADKGVNRQATDSYCVLNDLHFYGWKGANYDYATISLKNGHDYNLYRLRDTSSRSRYFIYVYDIGGKGSPSRKYFATSGDAVEALEEMDCRFCKWFKNKKGRNASYIEFSDWKNSYR